MKQIREEDNLQEQWYKDAKKQTIKTLPAFMKKILEGYSHDYGTICHAIAASAVAAAWAGNASKQGGITGFQAGCIMWEFIKGWMSEYKGKPLRLIDFSMMLYPQYEERFAKTMTKETWDFLQKEAQRMIDEREFAADSVVSHWKSIAAGNIPFGYEVKP